VTDEIPVSPRRLSNSELASLPRRVARHRYDRSALTTGIVHLGIGAFHRAHQAVYVDDILAAGDNRWGISGVSLRGRETHDALGPQDGLYTLLVLGNDAPPRVISSVREVLFMPQNPEAVLHRMSDPAVAIVSLTVTEKGYCHDPATGELDENHPLIRSDIADPTRPRSAVGVLAAAIARRRAAGVAPFTVLCCDNLPANGKTVHRILSRFAHLVSPDVGAFVESEIAMPSTMVDRITPATTDADRTIVREALDVDDAWPVVAEPFSQWVVEERFSGARPAFEAVGVEMVSDVAPYEKMKLRLLNGAHSALAYLGSIAGFETVADAMADPGLAAFVAALMEDASTTLTTPSEADRARYSRSLIARFGNTALRHRLLQIAMDGSQKLPQRILGVVRDRLQANLPVERHALAVAAWMRFVSRVDVLVDDPLATQLADIGRRERQPERLVRTLLSLRPIFGDLVDDERFASAVMRAFVSLSEMGGKHAAARYSAPDRSFK
jgi:fructuronate reductase